MRRDRRTVPHRCRAVIIGHMRSPTHLWTFVDRSVRRSPAGAILLGGLIALSVLGWLFGETTEAVVDRDDIAAVDDPVTRWLVANRQPWLTATMRVVTQLGSAWFVVVLLVIVTGLLWWYQRPWAEVVVVPVSSVGAAVLVTIVKLAIARPRPSVGEIVATASGFSFPSGHSAQAVACYGALAWLIAHLTVTRRSTIAAWAGAALVALAIGFSRLYLGVHWLSDVVGGFVLGAAWLSVTLSAVAAWERSPWSSTPDTTRTDPVAGG
jgi:membrane-associated phospholipid phosphatase